MNFFSGLNGIKIQLNSFKKPNMTLNPSYVTKEKNDSQPFFCLFVLGLPDFRAALCAKHPGEMNFEKHFMFFFNFLQIFLNCVRLKFFRFSTLRFKSDSNESWTLFFHLYIPKTPQWRARKLIQVLSKI